MKHIRTFESFKTNEIFSEFASALGKGSNYLSKGVKGVANKISGSFNKEDDDLGKEIIYHLKKMSTNYNRSGEYDSSKINRFQSNWYYFIGNPFSRSEDAYKVEVIKHLDYKTKNVPEYSVYISKSKAEDQRIQNRLSGRGIKFRDNDNGSKTYKNSNLQDSRQLKLSLNISKRIFNLAEDIFNKIAKNPADDARGK